MEEKCCRAAIRLARDSDQGVDILLDDTEADMEGICGCNDFFSTRGKNVGSQDREIHFTTSNNPRPG